MDGLGDSTNPGDCVSCGKLVGRFQCSDCLGGNMYCAECVVLLHRHLPLHRLQVLSKLPVSQPRYITIYHRSGWTDFSSGQPSRASVRPSTLGILVTAVPSLPKLEKSSLSTFPDTTLSASVSAIVPRVGTSIAFGSSYVWDGTRPQFSVPKPFSRLTFWTRTTRFLFREN